MERERFHYKGFVSFLMALGFTVLTVSGLVLYISPRGRVANWTGWSLLGIEKENWAALHVVVALLVVIAAVFHLIYNWRIFWGYIKTRMESGLNKKRELAAALLVTVLVMSGTIFGLQPFKSVTLLGEQIKDTWESKISKAPYAHAELSTITDYAQKTGSNVEAVKGKLASKGIQVTDSAQTIAQIAEANHITPEALFSETASKNTVSHEGQGTGPGQKTITQLATEVGKTPEDLLAALKTIGVEAKADETLRTIADRSGKNPHDLLSLLKP